MVPFQVISNENPQFNFIIVHGMCEHSDRYVSFAQHISTCGGAVYLYDHLGHKNRVHSIEELGYFHSKKGVKLLIKDLEFVITEAKRRHPDLPIYIFGHSMGSMIVRNYLLQANKPINKVILSGVVEPNIGSKFARMLSNFTIKWKGERHRSKWLTKVSIDRFNKKINSAETNYDWLSYNVENIKNYRNDPYCNFMFTAAAYRDLFTLNCNLFKTCKDEIKYENKQIEVLLVNGKEDPCTGFEKGVNKSIRCLKKQGFVHIISKQYKKMRHEILNEYDAEIVINDIIKFIQKQ